MLNYIIDQSLLKDADSEDGHANGPEVNGTEERVEDVTMDDE